MTSQYDANGFTALICAVRAGDKALVEARIKAGDDVNAADTYGRTALMWAAILGSKEVAALLVKAGADLNAADTYGRTALMMASEYGSKEVADILNRFNEGVRGRVAGDALFAAKMVTPDVAMRNGGAA